MTTTGRRCPTGLLLAAFWLLAACAAGPVPAQTTPQFDQRTISEDFVLRLVQITTSLRGVGIVDSTRINEFFARAGSSPFTQRLPDDDARASPVLWSYFFRNTQLYYGHVRHGAPVVGYYDPFSDFWLITRWDNSTTDPVLVQAGLVPSEVLADPEEPPEESPLPTWMRDMDEGALVKVLPERVARAVGGFEARFPFAARTPASMPVLSDAESHRERFRNRLSRFFSTLLALQADTRVSKIYLDVLDAVEDGDPLALRRLFDGPTHMPVTEVVSFPDPFRQDLEPVMYLPAEGGTLVLSGRIDNGRWYLLCAFDDAQSPNLGGIAYVDLFARAEER